MDVGRGKRGKQNNPENRVESNFNLFISNKIKLNQNLCDPQTPLQFFFDYFGAKFLKVRIFECILSNPSLKRFTSLAEN